MFTPGNMAATIGNTIKNDLHHKEAHIMNRYNIRKVFVWPAFKFGVIIGTVLMITPGIGAGPSSLEGGRAVGESRFVR